MSSGDAMQCEVVTPRHLPSQMNARDTSARVYEVLSRDMERLQIRNIASRQARISCLSSLIVVVGRVNLNGASAYSIIQHTIRVADSNNDHSQAM